VSMANAYIAVDKTVNSNYKLWNHKLSMKACKEDRISINKDIQKTR